MILRMAVTFTTWKEARHWLQSLRGGGVALAMFVLLLGTSCDEDSDFPPLSCKSVTPWHIPPIKSRLPGPRSVAVDGNDGIVVLDNAGRVLVFSADGKVQREWMMPEYDVGRPEGAVVLDDGRVVVCDTHYHRVVIFDDAGKVLKMFGEYGRATGQFIYPVAVAVDSDNQLYIGEYGSNDRIQVFTPEGIFVRQFGGFGTEPGEFQRPSGIVWHEGKVFVADAINNRVQEFTDRGDYVRILSKPDADLKFPYDLSLAPDGSLFIIEYGAGRITQMNQQGDILARFGSSGRGREQFVTPWGIAVDSKGRIYVADTGNRRLVAIELASE
ncbi:MAG: iron(III) transport system ATP-binding protein [Verrucomicrobiales bacterium]|jgi:iron(III) transport system ATP-binding protein